MKKMLVMLYLLSSSVLHAEITPIVQLGVDMIVIKKPSSTIEAKSGYTFEAGFKYATPDLEQFSTQFLLGYKKDALSRILKKKKNVPITFTRK
jgi:hypothetical protein